MWKHLIHSGSLHSDFISFIIQSCNLQQLPQACARLNVTLQTIELRNELAVNGTFHFNDNCNFLSLHFFSAGSRKVFSGFTVIDVNVLCEKIISWNFLGTREELNWNLRINWTRLTLWFRLISSVIHLCDIINYGFKLAKFMARERFIANGFFRPVLDKRIFRLFLLQ